MPQPVAVFVERSAVTPAGDAVEEREVEPLAAVYVVVAGVARDRVVACAARDRVVAVVAADDVVAARTVDGVVARAGLDHVVLGSARR